MQPLDPATILSDQAGPSFDDLRYRMPWLRMVERYGISVTIDALITWQALNRWDADWWGSVLVEVFGEHVKPRALILMEHPVELQDRFLLLSTAHEGYIERIRAYCEAVLKHYQEWATYDP